MNLILTTIFPSLLPVLHLKPYLLACYFHSSLSFSPPFQHSLFTSFLPLFLLSHSATFPQTSQIILVPDLPPLPAFPLIPLLFPFILYYFLSLSFSLPHYFLPPLLSFFLPILFYLVVLPRLFQPIFFLAPGRGMR